MGTVRDHGITKLYNFRPAQLDCLEDTLRENHIHCSNPENFNDPWDCKPYFDPSSVDDPVHREQWIEFFKEHAFAMLLPDLQAEMLRDLGPSWYENTTFLRQCVEKTRKAVLTNNAAKFRVFYLAPAATSLLMWAHYADKHKGLCLEFDATKEKLWQARRVVYLDKLPHLTADLMTNPEMLLERSLLTKSTEWSYEEEYRILGRDADPAFSLATESDFLQLPTGAITAVIAGSRANIDAVRETVRKCAPGLPVKRAMMRSHEYHLDIIDDSVI